MTEKVFNWFWDHWLPGIFIWTILSIAVRIGIVVWVVLALASAYSKADIIKPTDEITVWGQTIYNTGNTAVPDSIRVITIRAGVVRYDAWHNVADAVCDTVAAKLYFFDQFQDIDGAGGDGFYQVIVDAYDTDSTLYTPRSWSFTVGTDVDANLYAVKGDSSRAEYIFELWSPWDSTHAPIYFGDIWATGTYIQGALSVTRASGGPAISVSASDPNDPAIALYPGPSGPGIYVSNGLITQNVLGDRLIQLSDSSAAQGAAAGLTAAEIVDSMLAMAVSDTVTGTLFAQLIRDVAIAGDTTLWANTDSIINPILAHVDTIATLAGYNGGGFAEFKQHTDVDTMFLGHGTLGGSKDTSHALILLHTGAGDGAPPDSSFIIDWP